MSDRIGGWNVTAASTAGGSVTADKAAGGTHKQHVIYALDISFSANPAAAVKWEILQSDASPGTVLASGYASSSRQVLFPGGLCVPVGGAVSAFSQAGGGSVVTALNLHGVTR